MTGKQFLYIAIATFITVIIWFTLDLIHSQTNTQIPPDVSKVMEPVSPDFDKEVLNEIGG